MLAILVLGLLFGVVIAGTFDFGLVGFTYWFWVCLACVFDLWVVIMVWYFGFGFRVYVSFRVSVFWVLAGFYWFSLNVLVLNGVLGFFPRVGLVLALCFVCFWTGSFLFLVIGLRFGFLVLY